jgi:hypothetical protein
VALWTPESGSKDKGFEVTDFADTLKAIKDYNRPHDYEIKDRAKKTDIAIIVVVVATFASIALIVASNNRCDERKLGIGLLLACATGVCGFITGGSLKP